MIINIKIIDQNNNKLFYFAKTMSNILTEEIFNDVLTFMSEEDKNKFERYYLWLRRKSFIMFLAQRGYISNGDEKTPSNEVSTTNDKLFDVEDMTRYITKFL